MKETFVIIYFLFNIQLFSQSLTFNKVYNPYNKNTFSLGGGIQKKGNGYITFAAAGDTLNGNFQHVLLNEIDSIGNLIKIISLASDSFNYYGGNYGSLIQTTDGGYFLPCSKNYSSNNSDHYLIRFNANMDTLWTKTLDHDSIWEVYYQPCETYDKGFACVGFRVITSSLYDVLLAKFDSLGNKLWEKTISLGNYSIADQIKETIDKGLLISGYRSSNISGSGDPFIIKLDSAGNIKWYRILGSANQKDGGASFAITPQGDYIVAYAYSINTSPWPSDDWYEGFLNLMKIGNDGHTIWSKMHDTLRKKVDVSKVQILQNNIILVMGTFYQPAIGFDNQLFASFVFKFNANGDSLYRKKYCYSDNPSNNSFLKDNIINSDGSITAIGIVEVDTMQAYQKIWIVKTDSTGYAPGPQNNVGLKELQIAKGQLNIFPNPATTQTTITYTQQNKESQLQIYNMLGQMVYEEKLAKGSSQCIINTTGFKPGLYKVVVGDSSETLVIN